MLLGWRTHKIDSPVAKLELESLIEEIQEDTFHIKHVKNEEFGEEGILITTIPLRETQAEELYESLLKEKWGFSMPTPEQFAESMRMVEESNVILGVRAISTVIEPIWATVDGQQAFPYVDVFNTEEEAREEIGKEVEPGVVIVSVKQGWHIRGTENLPEQSKDFYETYQEAEKDFNERIMPIEMKRIRPYRSKRQ